MEALVTVMAQMWLAVLRDDRGRFSVTGCWVHYQHGPLGWTVISEFSADIFPIFGMRKTLARRILLEI